MPDDVLLDSGVPEEEPSVAVEPSQEQEISPSDDSTDEVIEDSNEELPEETPDDIPEDYPDDIPDDLESDIPENEYGDVDEPLDEENPDALPDSLDVAESSDDGSSVSANEVDYEQIQDMINRSVSENNVMYFSEDYTILEDLEEFESSTVLVDRYQYAVLEKLEFLQYAHAIVIALLFLILFMRYKK